jgi:hypothetical protein
MGAALNLPDVGVLGNGSTRVDDAFPRANALCPRIPHDEGIDLEILTE